MGKAMSLPWSGGPERYFTQVYSGLAQKHDTRLESLPGTNTLA